MFMVFLLPRYTFIQNVIFFGGRMLKFQALFLLEAGEGVCLMHGVFRAGVKQ